MSATYARQVGIAVDHRRINESEDSLSINVQRLKEYLAKLKVLKSGEKPTVATVQDRILLPIKASTPAVESRKITDAERKVSVYEKLRSLYGQARHVGKGKKDEEK